MTNPKTSTTPNSRQSAFLAGSDALAGLTSFASADPRTDAHVVALLDATDLGTRRVSLSTEHIRAWACRLESEGGDANRTGAPDSTIVSWLDDLNARLPRDAPHRFPSPVATVELLSVAFRGAIRMSVSANDDGRLGRLVTAYVAAWCGIPPIVISSHEAVALDAAAASESTMRVFLAAKLREAVYDYAGRLGERFATGDLADRYAMGEGRELIVEWHDLVAAETGWRLETERSA